MSDDLQITWVDPKKLKPYKKNSRVHSEGQVKQIADLIKEFGFDVPIVTDKNLVIIKGHGRRLASLKLKLKKVPVIVSKLDRESAIAARIADNKVPMSAAWDNELLAGEIQELQKNADELVALTGFTQNEIQSLLVEWESDIGKVTNTQDHLEGIQSWIKIKCPKELRDTLKDFLLTKIEEQGFEDVTVE